MANSKVSALSAISPSLDDNLYLVDDPEGTPTSSKCSVYDLIVLGNSINKYHDASFPSGGWIPDVTNPPEFLEYSYGSTTVDAYAFDPNTEEALWCHFRLPQDYNGGVLRWGIDWDVLALSATGDVVWGLSGGTLTNNQPLSTVMGAERTLTDTVILPGNLHQTGYDTTGITLAGSADPGNLCTLKLVAKDNSTVGSDILFLNMQLQYESLTIPVSVFA